jgi:quercetin dioxygenase-like cupin family protein
MEKENLIFETKLELVSVGTNAEAKEVRKIFSGDRRQLLEITLRDGAILTKHSSPDPITVLCLGGGGSFLAGSELEHSQPMVPGTLVSLNADIDHEVRAEPVIRILVSKFKSE